MAFVENGTECWWWGRWWWCLGNLAGTLLWLFCTGWDNVGLWGTERSWLVIRDIIKSSFDMAPPPFLPPHTPPVSPVSPTSPKSPQGHFSSVFMALHPIIPQQKGASPHKPQPAACLPPCMHGCLPSYHHCPGIHWCSPVTIKRNLRLNKKSYTIFAQTNYDERQWRQGLLM